MQTIGSNIFGAKGIVVYKPDNFGTVSKRLDGDHQVFDLLVVSDDNKANINGGAKSDLTVSGFPLLLSG